MNAPTNIALTEAQQIEMALDALLTAAIAADKSRPLLPDRGPVQIGDLIGEELHQLRNWTPAQREAHKLLSRPVAWALRNAVRTLGERLHEIGGLNAMQEACDRVADMDPANWGRRTSIMDARWDGIGRDGKSAGWCS